MQSGEAAWVPTSALRPFASLRLYVHPADASDILFVNSAFVLERSISNILRSPCEHVRKIPY